MDARLLGILHTHGVAGPEFSNVRLLLKAETDTPTDVVDLSSFESVPLSVSGITIEDDSAFGDYAYGFTNSDIVFSNTNIPSLYGNNWVIECSVKITNLQDRHTLFAGQEGVSNVFWCSIFNTNEIVIYSLNGPGVIVSASIDQEGDWLNQLRRLAFAKKGTDYEIWVDGVKIATAPWTHANGLTLNNQFRIGRRSGSTTNQLHGILDEVRVTVGEHFNPSLPTATFPES